MDCGENHNDYLNGDCIFLFTHQTLTKNNISRCKLLIIIGRLVIGVSGLTCSWGWSQIFAGVGVGVGVRKEVFSVFQFPKKY